VRETFAAAIPFAAIKTEFVVEQRAAFTETPAISSVTTTTKGLLHNAQPQQQEPSPA